MGVQQRTQGVGVARLLGVTALLITLAAVAGCSSNAPAPTPPASATTSPAAVRHDLAPLTKRFPAIGTPVSASWLGGTLGDDRVPGPSTYWIEAVIELEPAVASELRTRYAPASGQVPKLREPLRAEVPAGAFLANNALDQALSDSVWHTSVALHQDRPTLVIKSLGN